jgi:4'-phosphopantetheinyl transferase
MHSLESMWTAPPERLDLPSGVLHIWCVEADDPAHDLSVVADVLAPDELERARRFRFERDRRRYLVGRTLLRSILSRYLGQRPAALRFGYSEHGKPALLDNHSGLQFNVSNSASLVVYAVISRRAVGIDVEHVRELPDIDAIATQFFAPSEARTVQALRQPSKTAAFFACWTRKEAYIKAIGTGLSRPLDTFVVTFLPGETPRLAWVEDDACETERWSFESFSPADGYVSAVAVEGPRPTVRYWRTPPVGAQLKS